jgi:TolB protein
MAESTPTETSTVPQNNPPKTTKKIVFVSKRNGNSDIYVINEDGSDLKRLTNQKEDEIMPQWSPDGTKILYISIKKGKHEIWVVNSDGSNQLQLVKDCDITYPPSWSPDNTKILFINKRRIFVVNSDGSNLTVLTPSNIEATYPSWSPDGTRILCILRFLKLQNETFIYTMNPDGTDQVKLTRQNGSYEHPAWSPDGKKIVYANIGGNFLMPKLKIYKMDPDGDNNLELANGVDFRWSPDSISIILKRITYREVIDENTAIDTYGMMIIRADGNGFGSDLKITGTEISFPDWAPDSSKVAYVKDNQLFVYTIKNDQITPIKIPRPVSLPKWSTDGLKIVCSGKTDVLKKSSIFMASVDGTSITKLTNETADYDPVWAPGNK